MSTSRRRFLHTSAVFGSAFGLGLMPCSPVAGLSRLAASEEPSESPVAKPLRILILGGTGFIGPHQVRYAQRRGHALTLFNRGKTNPGLFPQIGTLHGDRAVNDYAALNGREWDVVIDNPTTLPRWVRQAAAVLKGHTKQYLYISTISAYARHDEPGADETAALLTTDKPDSENARALYGPLEALSEQEAQKTCP